MRILFATAEVDPFSKVGGLADVAASLPRRLMEMGHDVRVVAPCHRASMAAHAASTTHRAYTVALPGHPRDIDVGVAEGYGGVPVYLVADSHYFGEREVYGEPDDLLRYQFFCRAIIEMLKQDDWVPDIIAVESGRTGWRVTLRNGELTPAGKALAIQPTGVRNDDKRTRSPASGFGVGLTLRTGLAEQHRLHTGLNGGPAQSALPVVFGLPAQPRADYVMLHWPDGVAQAELGLTAGEVHRISELQRKISSCPVLFTWNGERFEFVTDFAGVGGLGYFSAPGVAAPPQVLEHVKIEPDQLRARDGFYELRITEPMEEATYVDRLELVAVDHGRLVRLPG